MENIYCFKFEIIIVSLWAYCVHTVYTDLVDMQKATVDT